MNGPSTSGSHRRAVSFPHPGTLRPVAAEAPAEEVAAGVLSRTPGRPSLSGTKEKSPSLTIRLPKQERARLEQVAAKQGRRTSEVVREALEDYLTRHTG